MSAKFADLDPHFHTYRIRQDETGKHVFSFRIVIRLQLTSNSATMKMNFATTLLAMTAVWSIHEDSGPVAAAATKQVGDRPPRRRNPRAGYFSTHQVLGSSVNNSYCAHPLLLLFVSIIVEPVVTTSTRRRLKQEDVQCRRRVPSQRREQWA